MVCFGPTFATNSQPKVPPLACMPPPVAVSCGWVPPLACMPQLEGMPPLACMHLLVVLCPAHPHPATEILDACEDVKDGLDESSSPAIARVIQWATAEALFKVNAMHPGVKGERREDGPPLPGGHPCQRPWPPPQEEYEADFIACVNRCPPLGPTCCQVGVQGTCKLGLQCRFMYHDCNSYCEKWKVDDQGNCYTCCRFFFPKKDQGDYMLVVESGRTVVSMAVPRNHQRIGAFVRVAVQGWRANCDFQLIVDHKALAEYICKYATKPEKETTTFTK